MKNLKDIMTKSLETLKEYEKFDFVEDWNNRDGDLQDGFDCSLCKNRGYFYRYYENSIYHYVEYCECVNRRTFVRQMKKKNLEKMLDFTVKDFKAEKDYQRAMKDLAIKYVKNDSRDWLMYTGQSGTGKSHLATAITVTLAKKNLNVEYISWSTFISDFIGNEYNNTYDSVKPLETAKNAQILYIDDLFKANDTKYIEQKAKNIAFDIINHRYNNHLTTIITSELAQEELLSIDEAITGRIIERCDNGTYFLEIEKDVKKNYRLNKNER